MRIFLSHTPDMLAHYYGERALAALREHGEVVLNGTGRVLDEAGALVRAAGEAQVLVVDRQTPVGAGVFAQCPALLAVCRVAVDIRNIDVAAASRQGILVTQATPGFVAAVAELVVGFMVDLARGSPRPASSIGLGGSRRRGWGGSWRGRCWGSSGTGRSGSAWRGWGWRWEWRWW